MSIGALYISLSADGRPLAGQAWGRSVDVCLALLSQRQPCRVSTVGRLTRRVSSSGLRTASGRCSSCRITTTRWGLIQRRCFSTAALRGRAPRFGWAVMTTCQTQTPRIARESSRVQAIGIIETQATYDIFAWEVLFEDDGLTLEGFSDFTDEQTLLSFYGVPDSAALESEAIMDYRADVDMQELLDASDAPIWILSDNQQEFEPTNTEAPYHAP